MLRTSRWVAVALTIAGLQLAACTGKDADADDNHQEDEDGPARVEPGEGTGISRVTLTARAAERLDIKTAPAVEVQVARAPSGAFRKVVPYAAVLYDSDGETWVYTNPEPRVFVRHGITIDYIDGDVAVLSDGPPAGTPVVTVGAAELFGTEFEIGH
jgi:hypothetical protein